MFKKSTFFITLILIFIAGFAGITSSFAPPPGSTGATGPTCGQTGCHVTAATPTGSVTVSGLPTIYSANGVYDFSLTITHGTADRRRWGFSIVAVNSSGTHVGTFSSTNPNADLNPDDPNELSHFNAPITAFSNSYTFANLRWKAPATEGQSVTFYYAAVAANANGSVVGDFTRTGTQTAGPLPISLNSFNAVALSKKVLLTWQTVREINSNYFSVQKSVDNTQFSDIGKVSASGNSSVLQKYSFSDNYPAYFEKPIYYRLAIVDKDGSKTYSKIENVVLKATSTYIKSLYPNPVAGGGILYVNLLSKENEVATINVIDKAGRLIKSTTLKAQKGDNSLSINLPVVAPGVYNIIVKSNSGSVQEAIVIR